MATHTNRREHQKERWVLWGAIASCFLFITLLSLQRNYFGFGTETDYLGGFLPEAQRVLAGEPLRLDFHPPLYSILLAFIQTIAQDWLKTGLFVSLISSISVLILNALFFNQLIGFYASCGAVFGLMTSVTFLKYSAYATSDIFALALYSGCLLLSLLAAQKRAPSLWILCGLAVGSLLLTRTNGITCLFIATLPFISSKSWKQKFIDFLCFITGICIPLLIWFCYASLSGSRLSPAGTYANFALTYFSPSYDRVSGDARIQVETQFNSLLDVLTYDPLHIVKTYIKDLVRLAIKMTRMLQIPLTLLVPVGLFSLLRNGIRNDRLCTFYLVLTLLQVLLINFKAYEARYFLFFLPCLGAAAGMGFAYVLSLARSRQEKRMVAAVSLGCIALLLTLSYQSSWQAVASDIGELDESVPQIQTLNLDGEHLISRKPHLPFYTNAVPLSFPNVETLSELECTLQSELEKTTSDSNNLFLYYGTKERDFRRQFKMLLTPESSPEWLAPVAQSQQAETWVLYKYRPDTVAIAANSCDP